MHPGDLFAVLWQKGAGELGLVREAVPSGRACFWKDPADPRGSPALWRATRPPFSPPPLSFFPASSLFMDPSQGEGRGGGKAKLFGRDPRASWGKTTTTTTTAPGCFGRSPSKASQGPGRWDQAWAGDAGLPQPGEIKHSQAGLELSV